MTVMVTGASGPIGHALVPLLLRNDEVRAAVRRPETAEPLRALGAKVTVGRLDDAGALADVLAGVYTVIHLVGGPNQPDDDALWDANHGATVRALAAATQAGARRFLLVSVPGASVDATDPYLRARGLAEEAVVTSGLDHAVIRSTHVCGVGSLWFSAVVEGALASPPLVIGDGSQDLAPVDAADLAAVLAAADDRDGPLDGIWGLEGPDPITADDLESLLVGADAPPPDHASGDAAVAALERLLEIAVSREAVAMFERPSRADAPEAAGEFGVARTPLVESIRRTLARASASPLRSG